MNGSVRKPLLIWAALVACGIALGRHSALPVAGWTALVVATAVVLAVEASFGTAGRPRRLAAAGWRLDDPRPRAASGRPRAALVQLVLPAFLLVACGALLYAWHAERLDAALAGWIDREPVVWSGRLAERPTSSSPGRTSFVVQVDRIVENGRPVPIDARVRLTVAADRARGADPQRFAYGDRVRVESSLRAPRRPGNPGEFDEWAWLSQMGVSATAYVSADDVHVVGRWGENDAALLGAVFRGWAIASQQWLSEAATKGVPAHLKPLLAALVAGDRHAVPDEMEGSFRASGMVHLLSVSGLHVGLMAAVIVAVLRKGMRLSLSWSSAAAIPLVAFYVALTGAAPPAVRAGLTVGFGLVALARGRPKDVLNAVGAAALFILAANPMLLFGPSFQLSFVATVGILFAAPTVSSTLAGRFPRLPRRAADVVTVPTVAQFSLYPLIAYHFGTFSPVGLVANVGAGSLLGIILPFGLLTAGLSAIDQLTGSDWATWAGWANGRLLAALAAWSRSFADWSYAALQVRALPVWSLLLYYSVIAVALGRRAVAESGRPLDPLFTRRRVRALLYGALVSAAVVVWWPQAAPIVRPLEVTIVDVGQGDAAVVVTPGGDVVLIDGGGRPEYDDEQEDFDVGESILVPFLKRRGISRIDWVFLSHAHEDHVEGVAAALKHFYVGEVIDPDVFHPAPSYVEYLALVDEKRIRRRIGGAGMELSLPDGVRFRVVGPTAEMRRRFAGDPDNASLVVEVQYRSFRMLFTGDLNAEGQRQLLRQGAWGAADPVSVLKVPHHGSRNALFGPFLDSLSPKLAVVSVGSNPYGHPHEDVLEGLALRGSSVYRTDVDGAISVRTNGETFRVTAELRPGAEVFRAEGPRIAPPTTAALSEGRRGCERCA